MGEGAEVHGRVAAPRFFPPAARSTMPASREFETSLPAAGAFTFHCWHGIFILGWQRSSNFLTPSSSRITVPLSMAGALPSAADDGQRAQRSGQMAW